MPFLPKLSLGIVDVKDVAKMHIKAMTTPTAKNKRFLLSTKKLS